jgi:tetratricopeptide (TPR) repeat protein
VNREETLRRAELLLRQGRPDAAAEEYARAADANPGDLATANALGDLYVRLQRPDLAVPLYARVADIYLREGFFAKAAASYKKALKFEPQSAPILVRLAEACRAQGLRVEARGHLQSALLHQRRERDPGAVDDLLIRFADGDPADLEAAVAAAPARARRDGAEAIATLQKTASALEAAGRDADADRVRRLVAILEPGAEGAAAHSAPLGTAPGTEPRQGSASTRSGARAEADAPRGLDDVFARLRGSAPTSGSEATSRLALAETYLAAGLHAEAVPLLEALAADEATSDRAAWLMSGVCERQARFADAARWMSAALEIGLRAPGARRDALTRLGDLHERLGEPARALEAWRQARDLAPDSGDLDERIARVSSAIGGGGGPFTP